ncbi:hypothetical protein ACPA9J_14645 [Pseudomonas aeruginosa]
MQAGSTGASDHFAELLGIESLHSSFEQSACRLRIAEQHRNALGGIHGGLIFSWPISPLLRPVMLALRCISACRPRFDTWAPRGMY